MKYTAYGKECKLNFHKIFDGQWGVRAEYKNPDGDYLYISESIIITTELTTKELTDAAYQKALDEINISMAELLGKVQEEPGSGVDRIRWLVDNKTFIEKNKLKIG